MDIRNAPYLAEGHSWRIEKNSANGGTYKAKTEQMSFQFGLEARESVYWSKVNQGFFVQPKTICKRWICTKRHRPPYLMKCACVQGYHWLKAVRCAYTLLHCLSSNMAVNGS